MGISLCAPQYSLSSKEAVVHIRPCFSGPFELPDGYESASPAYLILHNKMHFQKDIIIRIHHYANLQSEEDCEDMAFLSASSTPEYRNLHPVYTFKEIRGSKGVFKPGNQIGEVALRHFCLVKAARKRMRENSPETSPETSPKKTKIEKSSVTSSKKPQG